MFYNLYNNTPCAHLRIYTKKRCSYGSKIYNSDHAGSVFGVGDHCSCRHVRPEIERTTRDRTQHGSTKHWWDLVLNPLFLTECILLFYIVLRKKSVLYDIINNSFQLNSGLIWYYFIFFSRLLILILILFWTVLWLKSTRAVTLP